MPRYLLENYMTDQDLDNIIKNSNFCIVPFMVLNTRPNGTCKTCSQAHELRAFHEDWDEETTNSSIPLGQKSIRFLNFTDNSLDEIWNSDFLTKFRMAKINGQEIRSCQNCYFEDSIGNGISKRYRFNRDYAELHKDRVRDAIDNGGRLSKPPSWWEMRLSSECNSACRMCTPDTSSLIKKQNVKNIDIIPEYDKSMTYQAVKFYDKWGYLGDNPRFHEEFWNNVDNVRYIEFHGGEPLIDKNLISLFQRLVDEGRSKDIYLNGYTNANVCSIEILQLLNQFKGGRVGVSIDGYGEENDYLRWPSKWSKIEENIENFKILGDSWEVRINSAMTVYQTLTIMKLVEWYESIITKPGMDIFGLVISLVKRPVRMSIEIIPYEMRNEVANDLELFIETSYACNTSKYARRNRGSLLSTAKLLRSKETVDQKDIDEFIEYTRIYDNIRRQDVLETFPELRFIFDGK